MTAHDQVTIDPPDAGLDAPAGRHSVRRIVADGSELVVKQGSGRARARLRHEADLLERLDGARVVELVDLREHDETTELVLADAGPRSLAELDLGTPDLTLRALQRLAEAVADLHRRGWTHGAICAEHAVVNRRGSVRLCSLGSARPVGSSASELDDDLADLLRVVDGVARAPVGAGGPLERVHQRADARRLTRLIQHAQRRRARGDLDAAAVALDLRDLRRKRNARDRAASGLPNWNGRRVGSVLVVAAPVLAAAVLLVTTASPTTARQDATTVPAPAVDDPAGSSSRVPCDGPAVDIDGDGCDDDVRLDGEIVEVDGARFALGIAGDTAVVGDWDCDGIATARLLRATSGEVFEFPSWATADSDTTGELVGVVEGALGVVRGDDPERNGCDVLYVVGPDGTKEEL